VNINNPVVKLCVEGIQAEFQGKTSDAIALYMQAWELRKDDFDACIAAHYIARQQQSAEEILRWNEEALERANAVNDERVKPFYPSLYLNVGYAHELLGNAEAARANYEQADAYAASLSADPYAEIVHDGIKNGLERTS
jgi:tetratricopeptide (TPR) repeat protein